MAMIPTKAPKALSLNNIGRQRVRDVADTMELPLDHRLIATLTGYRLADVRAVLKARKYRPNTRIAKDEQNQKPGSPIVDESAPQFAREVSAATGLQVQFFRNLGRGVSEWLLLGPTNITILIFYGREDILQGILPLKLTQLQGISRTQLNARRGDKKPRKEGMG